MKEEIFRSNRYFTTFDVLVSHGQFLLRSQKNESYTSNIDIIFFDTTYIQLFSRLNGLTIKMKKGKNLTGYRSVSNYLSYENNHLFEIESGEEKYYIAASFVKVFENVLEFNETSLGYEDRGRANEIASSL
ncbi:hypothetical protein [Niabella sp.]|uniref:hypothetical protein n=1 Tax=Niabella sp. TaxID=1962976 RepID=UPI0026024498|nr:hypothetical protein [Niabella sp.]